MLHTLLSRFPPPAWLRNEAVGRLSLLCNHVLQQEPEAQQRLQRQSGRCIHLKWQQIEVLAFITPAGLLEVRPFEADSQTTAANQKSPDLLIEIKEDSSTALLGTLMKGEKPSVHIAGDVQLAAEINWLSQNVRWDIEEDASRLLGDAIAHRLSAVGQSALEALRGFIASISNAPSPEKSNSPPASQPATFIKPNTGGL